MDYIFMIIYSSLFIVSCTAENPVVEIAQGILKGKEEIDRKGNTFYSFQRIPYAKPPIGNLRFKAPQVADKWEGILEATEDVPRCYQFAVLDQATSGQEDCLYLNVYSRNLSSHTLQAVMVFIHGGSFTEGFATRNMYGPEFLLPEGVVLVTINYRLGIFGGFSIDDPDAEFSGNAGLKDQTMALRWIKNNILKFGGDPDNVSIFGESAGAISVHGHVLSPMSKGLFRRAIAESGAFTMPMEPVRNSGLLLGQVLGVQTDDITKLIESLQNMTTSTIFLGQQMLILEWPSIFFPISEISSKEPIFLSDEPINLITSGNYNHVPFMIGYNDAEGIINDLVARLVNGEPELVTDFSTIIPYDLGIINGTNEAAYLSEKIKQFYYGNKEPSTDNMQPFIQLHTDSTYAFPTYRTAIEHEKTMNASIYFYRFSADTKLNFLKPINEVTAGYSGAAHTEELGYLFANVLQPEIETNSVEDIAIHRMVKLWANFAKYDNPTPDNFDGVKWESINGSRFNFLNIGTYESVMGVNPDQVNIKFWRDIYDEFYRP